MHACARPRSCAAGMTEAPCAVCPRSMSAAIFRFLASSGAVGLSAKNRGASWGHRASGTDSGSALPPFSGRVLIASILAWLTTPKTMHMQTALTQLIMALAHMEHADQDVAACLHEMKDILRSRRSCLSGGVFQFQELDPYCMTAPFVLWISPHGRISAFRSAVHDKAP